MTGISRRSVLAAIGVSFTTAGCVTDSGSGSDTEESTTGHRSEETSTTRPPTETADETTTSEKATTTDDWVARASKEPDPDHSISLRNELSEARTVRTRIVRKETGETVYEETHEVSGGSEIVAYNLEQADPEGVEAFRVCGQLVGPDGTTATTANPESDIRDCATVKTSECYGNAHVTVQKDGSLQVIYAIC